MHKSHSVLGASSAHRWLACPGSIRLSEGIPKTSSTYADEGTAAHRIAEDCLRSGMDAAKYLGGLIPVNGANYEVTREMVDAVQLYLDLVREDLCAAPGSTIFVEHKFRLNWLYDGLFGTNDTMICEPFGVLKVYDFKYGAGVPVEADHNPQMMYYALGAAKGDAYEEVELVIVQPRAPHVEGPVRRFRMSIEELTAWGKDVLLPGAKATEDENAPLNAGEHCRFCPALAVCPAQKALAVSVAKEVFADKPASPPSPDQLTNAELKKILDVSDLIEAWLGACRAYVQNLLETGRAKSVDIGYKIVAGKASRSWKDEKAAESWLSMLLDDEAYTKKLLSPAQAEKLLKGDAKAAVKELVEEKRGNTLVPLSDKREEKQAAITAFTEVDL
jgi:hypothetical protein